MSPPVALFCGNPEPHETHDWIGDHGASGVYTHVCPGVSP